MLWIWPVEQGVVVEQNCPYQDIDGWDPHAHHLWLKDEEGVQAYLRVLPQNTLYADAPLGRVISIKRRCGLTTRLLQEGITLAREKLGAKRMIIGAQTYACPVYEKVASSARIMNTWKTVFPMSA